jgi:O-acetyl-ADP-ribose deacetylase (regulator of RNase III)
MMGGGVDWWVAERRGVRLEARDQLLAEFGTTHLLVARIELVFR